MSCRKIRRSLSQYYRGELSQEKEKLVIQHIQVCEGCAREAQRYQTLKEAVQNLKAFEPSPDFEANLERKIRELPYLEKKDKKKALVTSFPSLRWVFIPAIAMAVALVLLLKGGFHKSQTTLPLKETEVAKIDTMVNENKKLNLPVEDSFPQKDDQKIVSVKLPGEKKGSSKAVFVLDNMRLSDLEQLPDSRIAEDRLNNYVMDAVKFRSVDYKSSNEVYILPAVSTGGTKVKISY
ncbi:MAG: zf-HC2 domain-containing protein [candidate division Zixibacteria bacterium]|nr:zf-HC2 domain-containing protein [candidate division Zixibacteria bacterium]